jgi:hypothetical protein
VLVSSASASGAAKSWGLAKNLSDHPHIRVAVERL